MCINLRANLKNENGTPKMLEKLAVFKNLILKFYYLLFNYIKILGYITDFSNYDFSKFQPNCSGYKETLSL